MDDNTRQEILDFHNKKREEIAKGYVTGFNGAKNMYKLRWSCKMERHAKKFIQFCDSKINVSEAYGYFKLDIPVGNRGPYTPYFKLVLEKLWESANKHRLGKDNKYSGDGKLYHVVNVSKASFVFQRAYSGGNIFNTPTILADRIFCISQPYNEQLK
ncbi:hypothetical protein Y032_0050g2030 [Ancylostoma ceylanicum]|uniref:SCP domain-containing protein n=1 Tax=Ancylostoma ceylanicum TaxID=53326 RepID=A0A016UAP8_9BILA|nr:hypothetical protein Y032_0050g2030 [Ancylostoma ceylanicum]